MDENCRVGQAEIIGPELMVTGTRSLPEPLQHLGHRERVGIAGACHHPRGAVSVIGQKAYSHRLLDLREQLLDVALPIRLIHDHRTFLVGVEK